MNSSILNDIKKLLGIDATDTNFDNDIIPHINTALILLNQMGVGPETPFSITGSTETWTNFLGSATEFATVKSWMYLEVKSLFDPSASSVISETFEREKKKLEFMMQVQLTRNEANQNE